MAEHDHAPAPQDHAVVDDGHAGGHGGAHDFQGEQLGPVNLTAWAYALAGACLGLLTAVGLYLARGA
jgi:hypothetical protein